MFRTAHSQTSRGGAAIFRNATPLLKGRFGNALPCRRISQLSAGITCVLFSASQIPLVHHATKCISGGQPIFDPIFDTLDVYFGLYDSRLRKYTTREITAIRNVYRKLLRE